MAAMMRIPTLQSDPAAFIAGHSPPHSAGALEFPHNHPSSCQGHGGLPARRTSLCHFLCVLDQIPRASYRVMRHAISFKTRLTPSSC